MMMFKPLTPVSENQAGEIFREFSWQLAAILQRTARTRTTRKTTVGPVPKITAVKRGVRAC
ncbi:MAG TPA: hypothetical protein ENJ90_09360 [Devosia sp.]|nr:hypothetical protein [Devosia sp.]